MGWNSCQYSPDSFLGTFPRKTLTAHLPGKLPRQNLSRELPRIVSYFSRQTLIWRTCRGNCPGKILAGNFAPAGLGVLVQPRPGLKCRGGGISVSTSSHDFAGAFPFCRGKFIMPGQCRGNTRVKTSAAFAAAGIASRHTFIRVSIP